MTATLRLTLRPGGFVSQHKTMTEEPIFLLTTTDEMTLSLIDHTIMFILLSKVEKRLIEGARAILRGEATALMGNVSWTNNSDRAR